MPIEVFCDSCQKKLRVPDTAAGKRIKCPKCQGVISVPAGDAAAVGGAAGAPAIPTPSRLANKSSGSINVPKLSTPTPTPKSSVKLPAKAPVEQWYVQTEDGQQYGPVTRTELDQWYAEGRVTTDTQLLRDGSEQWQWASDLFPDLAPQQPGGGGVPDFGAMAAGGAPAGGSGPFDFGASSSPATTSSGSSNSRGKGKGGKKRGKKGGGSPHIDYIAYVCYLMGGIVVLSGLACAAASATVAGMVAGKDASWLIPICIAFGVFMMLFSIPSFAAGYGLQQRASWARMLTIVLAIIGALSLSPLNIAFAAWCWIVLTDKDNVAVFA